MIKIKVVLLLSSIAAIALCHFAIFGQVQTDSSRVEIHGQVRFAEGGAPATNVVVRLESYDGGGSITEAFTDSNGKFRLHQSYAGNVFGASATERLSRRTAECGYDDDIERARPASASARRCRINYHVDDR